MKNYIASFTDDSDRCWDLEFRAENWKEAQKVAKLYAKDEKLKLYSVRLQK